MSKVANPKGFNTNTVIGIVIAIITLIFSTVITRMVNTVMDRQETNSKIIAEVPAKIESVKTEVSHKQELASIQVGQVQKDLTSLAEDVKEGKKDVKDVKESQSKMITREELNSRLGRTDTVIGEIKSEQSKMRDNLLTPKK